MRQLLGHIKHPKHEHTTAVTSSDFSKLLLGLDKHYISVKKANSSATKDANMQPLPPSASNLQLQYHTLTNGPQNMWNIATKVSAKDACRVCLLRTTVVVRQVHNDC